MELLYKPNSVIHSGQIADCLATIGHLMGWLNREVETPVEGNVQTSLESTIIRTCNRLDAILDDDTRWQLPKVDAHALAEDCAALNNGLTQAELHKRTTERDAVMQKLATVANLLGMDKKKPADEPPAQPSRRKNQKNP
jgi:hypothetical protein